MICVCTTVEMYQRDQMNFNIKMMIIKWSCAYRTVQMYQCERIIFARQNDSLKRRVETIWFVRAPMQRFTTRISGKDSSNIEVFCPPSKTRFLWRCCGEFTFARQQVVSFYNDTWLAEHQITFPDEQKQDTKMVISPHNCWQVSSQF